MQTAFTTKKDYGKGQREAQWATAQRTLHGLQAPEAHKSHRHEQSDVVKQAKKRAEVARFISQTSHVLMHNCWIPTRSYFFIYLILVNLIQLEVKVTRQSLSKQKKKEKKKHEGIVLNHFILN